MKPSLSPSILGTLSRDFIPAFPLARAPLGGRSERPIVRGACIVHLGSNPVVSLLLAALRKAILRASSFACGLVNGTSAEG